MTFLEIQQEIADRLGITHIDDLTRLDRGINRRYRSVTSSVGLVTSRRIPVTQAVTIATQTVTFTGVEKLINVRDSSGRVLDEIPMEMLRDFVPPASDAARRYAIETMGATSVTIRLDVLPLTAFVLSADGHDALTTLSGSEVPAFPESFHDILVWGVLADEYRKLEKLNLAQDADNQFERRLSSLRQWIMSSAYLDVYPTKAKSKKFYHI